MAFVHGKSAAVSLKDGGGTPTWRDISAYTDEVTLPFKVAADDTTTFGKSAKTYLTGLRDATMTIKGQWDNTATSGPDVVLSGLLGYAIVYGNTNGLFQFSPEGGTSGKVRYYGDCILTGYEILSPVANVVGFTASFQLSGTITRDTAQFVTGTTA